MQDRTCNCGRFPGGDLCPTPHACGFNTTGSSSVPSMEWSFEVPTVPGFYWVYSTDDAPVFGKNPQVLLLRDDRVVTTSADALLSFVQGRFQWFGPISCPPLPQKG